MHPIERLRHVARAGGSGPTRVVLGAARALAGLSDDHAALVTGCRQLVDRSPSLGAMWVLCTRVLCSDAPERETWAVAEQLSEDPTTRVLSEALPADAHVVILGWPEIVAPALPRRGDLQVLVVDIFGEGSALVDRLVDVDVDAIDVPESGLGSVCASADVVLLEALAAGPGGVIAPAGSLAAAAVARHAGGTVWAVAGACRVLPGPLWDALCARLSGAGDPWDAEVELVPANLIDLVVGPWGSLPPDEAAVAGAADCPVAAELFKGVFAPGTRR